MACFHCNRRKSDKQNILLFNPRQMSWAEHFIWSTDGLLVISQSEIGTETIELLDLNRARILQIRLDDILVNRHPLKDDPIQI